MARPIPLDAPVISTTLSLIDPFPLPSTVLTLSPRGLDSVLRILLNAQSPRKRHDRLLPRSQNDIGVNIQAEIGQVVERFTRKPTRESEIWRSEQYWVRHEKSRSG